MKRIGVLAVQGAFIEHCHRLKDMGFDAVELRNHTDAAQDLDGLVLPGGESTVQSKLLNELGMFDPLRAKITDGTPVLGTCAGLILLAHKVENGNGSGLERATTTSRVPITSFASLPVTVVRNAYGRQLGSFHATGVLHSSGSSGSSEEVSIPMTFIRAPHISDIGDGVDTIASLADGTPVAVQYKNQIGITFHPELDDDQQLYSLFASML
ncbi:pyridoxal 5'-phosphate synthase glutaminase subunit PdxT [Arcanobacterium bovis]|uniref:glutaminase n=1 Tax=Arcanobacterium bovis TaxID=2529275 RepID=A0A4Q9V0J6_9ACTO|nr:pyridoxal 5'-phosphate synthase glutaminase subunit PdxT [Arcanobacterium bovis]TBW22179.1 pyridoxal 5'-phosphate synthase glutaminase subunit PdxT [Arcanobacterium bovis]